MTVLTIFVFESQLMQMPGPRNIVIYWPALGHFILCKSPGTGHTLRCKCPGVPGGMVNGQIDTCISSTKQPICKALKTLEFVSSEAIYCRRKKALKRRTGSQGAARIYDKNVSFPITPALLMLIFAELFIVNAETKWLRTGKKES